MPNVFALIGEAWDFARKQSVVWHAAMWLIFLPSVVTGLVLDYQMDHKDLMSVRPETALVLILIQIILSLILVWGTICLLVIGKRLLQAKSGRSRTSLKVVRSEAASLIIPYVLTSILRNILTVLWGLLLIIPGIMYFIRTVFSPVIVACEGIAYRPALHKSADVVRGQFWNVTLTMICLGLLTLMPAQILSAFFSAMAEGLPPAAVLSAEVASSILFSAALTVYLFSLILAYKYFRPTAHVTNR
jgi:hypothetical protein